MKKYRKCFLISIVIVLLTNLISGIKINSFSEPSANTQKDFGLHSSISTSDPLKFEWYELWGDGSSQFAQGAALDSEDNIYLTGTHSDTELFLVKYSPDGNLNWSTIWNGVANVHGTSLALDSNGNIYVAGFFGTPTDVILVKFNATGDYVWHQIWSTVYQEEAMGIYIDEDDYIYLTGVYLTGTLYELILLKYDISGTLIWNKNWGEEQVDVVYDIDLDSNGNIFVTGNAYQGILTVKFDSSGTYIWHEVWGNEVNDVGRGLTIDSLDNVYVTGSSYNFTASGHNIALIKYDNNGNELWNRTWSYTHFTIGVGIALDSQENVYVVGDMYSNIFLNSNYTVVKYSKNGNFMWSKIWGGDDYDVPYAIVIDSKDQVYLAGDCSSYTVGGDSDIYLVKFSSLTQITVYSPEENIFFGPNAPNFHVDILEPDLNYSWYSLDNGIHKGFFTGSTGIIQESQWNIGDEGIVNITFYANNSLGDIGYSKISVKKDLTSPTSTISYIPHNATSPIPIVNSSTLFTINANDSDGAGVELKQYQIMLGQWVNYTHPFRLDNHISADYIIYFRAIDLVGNVEDTQQIIVQLIDTRISPPAIPGYNLFLITGAISVVTAIILRKRLKS